MKITYYLCGLLLMLHSMALGMADFRTTYNTGMAALNNGDLPASQKAVQDLLSLRGGKPNKEIDFLIRSLQGAIDKKVQAMPASSGSLSQPQVADQVACQIVEQANADFLNQLNALKAENDALRNELSNAEDRVIAIESAANTRIASIERDMKSREKAFYETIHSFTRSITVLDQRMNDVNARLDALKK